MIIFRFLKIKLLQCIKETKLKIIANFNNTKDLREEKNIRHL
ncbi:hypothetical protein TcasGA2_TC032531 [Tribolium castaneum]|uniref:Uncharacterized protein n=1 Tax=Tribolium castaneum TaxID=7070 RepID=A0A139WKK1_TRICA|nr:hypothetical protein TcasGA2_TC032531 [Tribolium castaneum]